MAQSLKTSFFFVCPMGLARKTKFSVQPISRSEGVDQYNKINTFVELMHPKIYFSTIVHMQNLYFQ